ncbi:hypothetical protein ACVWYQ_003329 [Bradyrhizobium sp. USDA 3397]
MRNERSRPLMLSRKLRDADNLQRSSASVKVSKEIVYRLIR